MAKVMDIIPESCWYDYDNQAWVVNGVYAGCGHPDRPACGCVPAGGVPSAAVVAKYGEVLSGR